MGPKNVDDATDKFGDYWERRRRVDPETSVPQPVSYDQDFKGATQQVETTSSSSVLPNTSPKPDSDDRIVASPNYATRLSTGPPQSDKQAPGAAVEVKSLPPTPVFDMSDPMFPHSIARKDQPSPVSINRSH